VNVRLWLTGIILLPLINGCALLAAWEAVKPIEVKTKAVERTRLNLPDPPVLQAREIKWVIITKENAAETFKKLEEKGVDIVLFGLTDEGYEQLAMTMAELRNLIATQRSIIIKYREYYEPTKTPDSK